jgi:hypothetical protein
MLAALALSRLRVKTDGSMEPDLKQPVEVVVRRARDFIRKRGRYDKPGKAN